GGGGGHHKTRAPGGGPRGGGGGGKVTSRAPSYGVYPSLSRHLGCGATAPMARAPGFGSWRTLENGGDRAGIVGHDPVGAEVEEARGRSEEHTSELQSRENLVC